MEKEVIEFFKFHRKMFCEDYLKKIPKDSIAYQATLKEKEFYDKAIKALERESSEDAYTQQVVKERDIAIGQLNELGYSLGEKIKALPPVTPTQKWIPVSERLPEEEGDYLLWGKVCEDEEEYLFIGSYDSGCEQFGIWEEQFDRTTLGCLGSEFFEYASVIAWRPLPEPYKAEMESEVCKTCYYNDGEVHAECVTCDKGKKESENEVCSNN